MSPARVSNLDDRTNHLGDARFVATGLIFLFYFSYALSVSFVVTYFSCPFLLSPVIFPRGIGALQAQIRAGQTGRENMGQPGGMGRAGKK